MIIYRVDLFKDEILDVVTPKNVDCNVVEMSVVDII